VDPVACTPPRAGERSGREPGRVWCASASLPRLRFKTYDELNAWLTDKCIAYAKAHPHPERPSRRCGTSSRRTAEAGRYRGRFDGFHALPASVSKPAWCASTTTILGERQCGRRPVEIHAYADRIVIRQDGRLVAEHRRSYSRAETIYDPCITCRLAANLAHCATAHHSRTGCCRRAGAGATQTRRVDDGDRQMVAILAAVLTDGLASGRSRLRAGDAEGVHSSDVIIKILTRHRDPGPAAIILTPDALTLRHAPVADCARLRSTQEHMSMGDRSPRHDGELKLFGMRGAYERRSPLRSSHKHEPQRFVGDLLKAEISEKQARSSDTS